MDSSIGLEEKICIIDHYTQQLTNSGYSTEQSRDIIQSSIKGIKRKWERREERWFLFRSGESTLQERLYKKLLESTSWFRDTEKEGDSGEEETLRRKEETSSRKLWRKAGKTVGRNRDKWGE